MNSLWLDTASLPEFAPLEAPERTDVLIIGGGLTGLLLAYRLQQAGVRYMLIEADRIMHGVSADTTAKITVLHRLIYDRLIRMQGIEGARLYWKAHSDALEQYRALCSGVDCEFEAKDAYVYATDSCAGLEKECAALLRMGIHAEFSDRLTLPFPIAGAIRMQHQAQFHPLKFAAAIVSGLNIRERTAAIAYDGRSIVTNRGRVTADKVIAATHFPLFNKHGAYFLKLYQHRSYVLALRGAQEVNGMYVDEKETGLSFRSSGDLLLLGGGAHRTGKDGGGYAALLGFAKSHYPDAQIDHQWATQDCMSLDGMPYIGQYGKNTPNLYVATGYNKWGMTSAMVAAGVLCDLVQEKPNPYAHLFSPARSMLRPQLLINGFESAKGLVTPTRPRCPHMGCALKWNAQEHTWDCPCHGSRFTDRGKLINNPSTGDLPQPPAAPSQETDVQPPSRAN